MNDLFRTYNEMAKLSIDYLIAANTAVITFAMSMFAQGYLAGYIEAMKQKTDHS